MKVFCLQLKYSFSYMGLLSWLFSKKIKDDTSVCLPKFEELSTNVVGSSNSQSELESISVESEFQFLISNPNTQELAYAEIGDYVNFWSPPNYPTKIIIFRRGSVMGGGRLGLVPEKYALLIQKHEELDLPVESEILEITNSSCVIRCRLIQEEEVRQATQLWQNDIRSKLEKSYKPTKPVFIFVETTLDLFKIGDKLTLKKVPDLDQFIKDPYAYPLIFTSLDNLKSVEKVDELRMKINILRLAKTYRNISVQVAKKIDNKYDKKSKYGLLIIPRNLF